MVQTSFGFSGRFWPIKRPLFQGSCCRGETGFSVLMVVSEADPGHLQHPVAVDRLTQLTPEGRSRAGISHCRVSLRP